MPKTSKTKALGDCYEAAGRYLLNNPTKNLKLVHAEVMGQGPIAGITFGHAFIIEGDNVIDKSNGRDIRMSVSTYFYLGRIEDIGNYFIYDRKQALEKMTTYTHWGPWDLVTESGL